MDDLSQRKLLSAACQGAFFFSLTVASISIPIVILRMSSDLVVRENAKEAINLHLNFYLYAMVVMLPFMAIGDPVLILIAIAGILFALVPASLCLPLLAIDSIITRPQTPYRYRSIWRLL